MILSASNDCIIDGEHTIIQFIKSIENPFLEEIDWQEERICIVFNEDISEIKEDLSKFLTILQLKLGYLFYLELMSTRSAILKNHCSCETEIQYPDVIER
ncbi:MAG: hypothetical protein ACTSW1_08685 [Candidatus Hodarchaeales archaeon]